MSEEVMYAIMVHCTCLTQRKHLGPPLCESEYLLHEQQCRWLETWFRLMNEHNERMHPRTEDE
jgi:hypothetical protein